MTDKAFEMTEAQLFKKWHSERMGHPIGVHLGVNAVNELEKEVAELREMVKRLVGNGIDLLNVDDVEDEEDAASIHAKFNDVVNEAGSLLAKHK